MNRRIFNRLVAASAVCLLVSLAAGASIIVAAELTDSTVDSKYLLKEKPEEAAEVIEARKDAKDQQEVVVIGRIGGRTSPWVKGAAAFSIVDRSLTPCNEIEGDTCKTPWDYCCEPNLPEATMFVMVTDEGGKPIRKDARQLLGVKELDTVIVQGKAKRDKAGNVSILASKLYVAPVEKESTR